MQTENKRKKKYYTVYLRKTDEIVAFGTSDECTEILHLTNVEQFYALVSKTRSGRLTRYAIVVDEDNEDMTE